MAANDGTILNNLEMYSWEMFICLVLFNLPRREYVVRVADIIMKGSVYKLAALPNTLNGRDIY